MLTKEQQELIAKSYIEIQSIAKTAEFCNVTSSQVRGVMKKYNITDEFLSKYISSIYDRAQQQPVKKFMN